MADDASYTSFLNKANEPMSTSSNTTSSKPSTSETRSKFDPTTQSNDAVPAAIKSLPPTLTYTSDTDSPFHPVFFSYSGSSLPSVSEFVKCLGTKAKDGGDDVEELSVEEFDPRGEYKEVIDAVKSAGGGSVGEAKVFRVPGRGSRVEYYVVTVAERKLVGVKTEAVES